MRENANCQQPLQMSKNHQQPPQNEHKSLNHSKNQIWKRGKRQLPPKNLTIKPQIWAQTTSNPQHMRIKPQIRPNNFLITQKKAKKNNHTHKTIFMWFGNLPTSTKLQEFHYYQGKVQSAATIFLTLKNMATIPTQYYSGRVGTLNWIKQN